MYYCVTLVDFSLNKIQYAAVVVAIADRVWWTFNHDFVKFVTSCQFNFSFNHLLILRLRPLFNVTFFEYSFIH